MMTSLLRIVTVTSSVVAAGLCVGLPAAAAATGPESASQNWAGYVATTANGSSGFTRVSGSWVQPNADPSAGDGDSAFWVGLGGTGQSQSLEQIGTQADVSGGQTTYYAWYELVPAAPVSINVPIRAGDHISASVSVNGSDVTVALTDDTSGASYTNTLQMSNPDTSSAEWIAEAPSASDGQGNLQTLPLANFGTVNFSNATATTDDGHTGSISDGDWTNQPVALSATGAAGAQPSSLSTDGSSFSVTWQGADAQTATAPGGSGDYGYDGGYGYGGGYGGGYGYGYGGGYDYGYGGGYSVPGYAYSY
jgi:hypothetical protein